MNIKSILLAILTLISINAYPGEPIPWGAMYTPNEYILKYNMKGVVKYYRGHRGAMRLLQDLKFAQEHGVKIIATFGSPNPRTYLNADGSINLNIVIKELSPFIKLREQIAPFIKNGTLWGIRFMDEPHDPHGMPRGFHINPHELGKAFKIIQDNFPGVKVGSTAPVEYMIKVPYAGFAFAQYNHANPPQRMNIHSFFSRQANIAHRHGLSFVASINANKNPVDNKTFWESYMQMCKISEVDFVTSWQWPQMRYPYPSFERRIKATRNIVREIQRACGWR